MTLLFDLRRFRSGVEQIDRQFAPEVFEIPDEDFRIIAPVTFAATLQKDAQKVRVTGRVQTTLECACSRCLEPFSIPVDAAFDALYLPAPLDTGAPDQELADDDVGVSFYKDDTIDFGDMVREQLYLVLPMKPLCRKDCQGLCPTCGINRNRETCTCRSEWVDPRLEGLRRFKTQ